MSHRTALMAFGLATVMVSLIPAQAQIFTIDCPKPNMAEIIKNNPGIPRATLEATVKEACEAAEASAAPAAAPTERTIDWPAADCEPDDQIEVKLRTIGFPPPFNEFAARIRKSCSNARQTDAPNPTISHVGLIRKFPAFQYGTSNIAVSFNGAFRFNASALRCRPTMGALSSPMTTATSA
jgi:hypothetical protein